MPCYFVYNFTHPWRLWIQQAFVLIRWPCKIFQRGQYQPWCNSRALCKYSLQISSISIDCNLSCWRGEYTHWQDSSIAILSCQHMYSLLKGWTRSVQLLYTLFEAWLRQCLITRTCLPSASPNVHSLGATLIGSSSFLVLVLTAMAKPPMPTILPSFLRTTTLPWLEVYFGMRYCLRYYSLSTSRDTVKYNVLDRLHV